MKIVWVCQNIGVNSNMPKKKLCTAICESKASVGCEWMNDRGGAHVPVPCVFTHTMWMRVHTQN